MGDWFGQQAGSGSMALAVPVALIAGLVSFFSPCVIPLLPGYLSYATGLSGADLAAGETRRGRMLAGSVLFVLGFSTVFVLLGTLSGAIGEWLVLNRRALTIGLGLLVLLLGVAFLGVVPWLQRDVRVHKVPAVGLAAAPLIGFLFGRGWAPCVGPTLGVVATLAYRRMRGALGWVRRHQAWVTRAGGAMLVLVGVLLLTGWWDYAVTWMQINLITGYEVSV